MSTKLKPRALIYNAVKEALDLYDSEQLLAMGCPKDEYEPEAIAIAEHIENHMGIIKLSQDHIPSPDKIWMICCVILHIYFHDITEPILYWKRHQQLALMIHERLLKEAGK